MDRIILDKYRNKIKQICHNNVRMFDNGNFIIDNVKENEKDSIIRKLKNEPYIDKVDSVAGRYDFSNPVKYAMGGSSRYYDIKGNLKKNLKESFTHTNTLLEAFHKLNEEDNEIVEYKGFKIEHFPITWKFKDTEFTNDGWIILSPEHFVGGDKDFPLPLRCHDKSPSKTIEFKTLDEAKAWIDKFGNNYKITIAFGDEIHAWPKEEIK